MTQRNDAGDEQLGGALPIIPPPEITLQEAITVPEDLVSTEPEPQVEAYRLPEDVDEDNDLSDVLGFDAQDDYEVLGADIPVDEVPLDDVLDVPAEDNDFSDLVVVKDEDILGPDPLQSTTPTPSVEDTLFKRRLEAGKQQLRNKYPGSHLRKSPPGTGIRETR